MPKQGIKYSDIKRFVTFTDWYVDSIVRNSPIVLRIMGVAIKIDYI